MTKRGNPDVQHKLLRVLILCSYPPWSRFFIGIREGSKCEIYRVIWNQGGSWLAQYWMVINYALTEYWNHVFYILASCLFEKIICMYKNLLLILFISGLFITPRSLSAQTKDARTSAFYYEFFGNGLTSTLNPQYILVNLLCTKTASKQGVSLTYINSP